MLRSGDTTDLKGYNAMMRQLLDQYVQAPKSEVLEKLEDFSFLDIIDANKTDGSDEVTEIDRSLGGKPAAAETLVANTRRYVVRKRNSNPIYYDNLSERLNKILEEMRQQTIEYKEGLRQLIELIRELKNKTASYPAKINTDGKKALYDNLDKDEALSLLVFHVVKAVAEQGFRDAGFAGNAKRRVIRNALLEIEGITPERADIIISIISNNDEF